MRLKAEESKELPIDSCTHREQRINELPVAKNYQDVASILGDDDDKDYPIFRESGKKDTRVKTIASGKTQRNYSKIKEDRWRQLLKNYCGSDLPFTLLLAII